MGDLHLKKLIPCHQQFGAVQNACTAAAGFLKLPYLGDRALAESKDTRILLLRSCCPALGGEGCLCLPDTLNTPCIFLTCSLSSLFN